VAATGGSATDVETLYRQRFHAFLLSVTAMLRDGDAALDVVQEGFALALARRSSFRGDGALEAWVWRIVLNLARDRLRARRPTEPADSPAWVDPATADDDIRSALLALPERQRIAIFLRYYADLSYDQIAVVLGVRPGTVSASLNAARSTLRRELQPELAR
jgi:RNA polymerase sigma factor (sigma-70 family)